MTFTSNNGVDNREKTKKMVKLVIILLIILLIFNVALIATVYYINLQTLKVNINGERMKGNIEKIFFVDESGEIYIAIKEFATMIGYKAQNGGYKEYSENIDECYIENENEVAEYSLESNVLKKYNKNTNVYELFEIDKNVKQIDNELYTSIQGISIGCNVRINYNKEKNNIDVYTLSVIVQSKVNEFETKQNKSSLGDEKTLNFNNEKAVLYGMMVVVDNEGKYGVSDLNGNEIIGTKYKSIEFIESSLDFIVKTEEDKVGIISYDKTFKIRPEYDSIKQMDNNLGLYIVISNSKQGVVNKDGKIIIYPEYESIGLENISEFSSIKNQYILFDKYIPVSKDKKWGWFDINGKQIVTMKYDGLGCYNKYKTEITGDAVLYIPEFRAIVVQSGEKYGIVKIEGTVIIQPTLEKVYSVLNSGKRQYFMIINNQVIDIEEYFTDKGIAKANN